MSKFAFSTFLVAAAFLAVSCAGEPRVRTVAEDAKPLPEISLEKIAEGVWVHKSYAVIEPWGPILSQGLVVERNGVVVLVDTAWTDGDTAKLLALAENATGIKPALVIGTHAHDDKIGGLDAAHGAGVISLGHAFTIADAPQRNLTPPQKVLFTRGNPQTVTGAQAIDGGGMMKLDLVEVFYPGPGHTRDNIVVYDPVSKVLFGGCLIRPGGSTNLGNTADGDVTNWADAVRKVAAAFPEAEIVVPSHGLRGGRELLQHTIDLAEAAQKAQ